VAGGEGVGDAALVIFCHFRGDGPCSAMDQENWRVDCHAHRLHPDGCKSIHTRAVGTAAATPRIGLTTGSALQRLRL
jgi:hypothetical protein